MKKEIINLNNEFICIKANYDSQPTKLYDANTRPSPAGVQKAKATLSELAWRFYENISNFCNRDVAVAPVSELMKELGMTSEQFHLALNELIENRFLNYRVNVNGDKIFAGNSFIFIPDNSLVGILTGEFEKDIHEMKKPFCYYKQTSARYIEEY